MSTIVEEKDRQVVPRWRSSGIALNSKELASIGKNLTKRDLGTQIISEKLEDWRLHPNHFTASDLVQTAFVLNQYEIAQEAAEYLHSSHNNYQRIASDIASIILGVIPSRDENLRSDIPLRDFDRVEYYIAWVRDLKSRLVSEPRNSIIRVDLALAYVYLGVASKAEHQINIALSLAGENRFVLRSANRLFLHLGKYDKAHSIIRQSARTPHDPWLLAAEIATASIIGRSSTLAKKGRGILESDSFSEYQTAELASALATIEGKTGSRKRSRRLFRKALRDPTENAVAQAEWTSRKHKTINIPAEVLERSNSYEARAWHFSHIGDWTKSLEESLRWLNDQPFSRRAINHAGYVASVGLDKYELAAQIYKFGLKTNPTDSLFLNNLAYSLASQGRVEAAISEFNKIDPNQVSEKSKIILEATRGLLNFRQGMIEKGRKIYQSVIQKTKSVYPDISATASTMLAREELIGKTKEAENALRRAIEKGAKTDDSANRRLLKGVKQLAQELRLEA